MTQTPTFTHRAIIIETPLSDGSMVYSVAIHACDDAEKVVTFDALDYEAACKFAEQIEHATTDETVNFTEVVDRTHGCMA